MGGDYILKIDPLWFRLDFIAVRYYTALFLAAIALGYLLWRWQARRACLPTGANRMLLTIGIPALLIGARLAHCFIYEPEFYLNHPVEILLLWRGGLASHGTLLTLPLVLVFIARKHGIGVLDTLDRFTFSAALGAALVRIGNFFNSEIVGRETNLSIGVRFVRYDGGSKLRHPTQLYEAAIGLSVFGLLLLADRLAGKEARPVGLLSGLFLFVYFTLRFFAEFTKAYQAPPGVLSLTMGQVLSIAPILVGMVLLGRILLNRTRRRE